MAACVREATEDRLSQFLTVIDERYAIGMLKQVAARAATLQSHSFKGTGDRLHDLPELDVADLNQKQQFVL